MCKYIIPALHSLAPRFRLVVPLIRLDDVLFDDGEGVDDVGAQRRVDVFGQELGRWRAILGPVRVVANTYVFLGACRSGVTVLI